MDLLCWFMSFFHIQMRCFLHYLEFAVHYLHLFKHAATSLLQKSGKHNIFLLSSYLLPKSKYSFSIHLTLENLEAILSLCNSLIAAINRVILVRWFFSIIFFRDQFCGLLKELCLIGELGMCQLLSPDDRLQDVRDESKIILGYSISQNWDKICECVCKAFALHSVLLYYSQKELQMYFVMHMQSFCVGHKIDC